jgi:hypothetical protein
MSRVEDLEITAIRGAGQGTRIVRLGRGGRCARGPQSPASGF